ncbi:MAG: hypothetical protein Q9167_000124 [Letrouitia subvulpina]
MKPWWLPNLPCRIPKIYNSSSFSPIIVRLSSTSSATSIQPPPSSTHHHDLPSFLAYAHAASLTPTKSVFIGTYYEYLCAATLARLSFSLTRTGGRSDNGIDLLGHWHLPTLPYPLRVLVQCKATKAKASPEVVRELEGMLVGAPKGWRGERTIGVLCAKRPATKGVREAIRRCRMPVLWLMVEEMGKDGECGRVRQMLWNQKVNELGAEGLSVGLRYAPGEEEKEVDKEVALMWKGEVWERGDNGATNAGSADS